MPDENLSYRLLPEQALRGRFAGLLDDGWSIAALGYSVAIGIYAIAVVFFVIPVLNGAPTGVALYTMFGRTLAVACPALITCLSLTSRGRSDTESARSKRLFGIAITLCAVVGPILAVLMLIGAVGVLMQSGPLATGVEGVLIQLAAFVVASVSTIWALSLRSPAAAKQVPARAQLVA
jgi:hypothetical protein